MHSSTCYIKELAESHKPISQSLLNREKNYLPTKEKERYDHTESIETELQFLHKLFKYKNQNFAHVFSAVLKNIFFFFNRTVQPGI